VGNPPDTSPTSGRRQSDRSPRPCQYHRVRRIFPVPDAPSATHDAGLDELYGVPRRAPEGRPWVGLCMIASLDGSTVVDGRSGALGAAGDRAVFAALRRAADAILVGSATARAEKYRAPKRDGQRIGVVTSTGAVDQTTDLFSSGAGFLVMPEDGPAPPSGVDVVRAGTGRVDLGLAVSRLGEVMAPPVFVQAEGGPRLNAGLLGAGCVDELNLSVAPLVVGGDGPRLVAGAADTMQRFEPVHVLADDEGYLFSRWVRRPAEPGPG